jgi:hypothetical protein
MYVLGYVRDIVFIRSVQLKLINLAGAEHMFCNCCTNNIWCYYSE